MPAFKIHEAFRSQPEEGTDEDKDHKQKGNDAFKEGKFDEALQYYNTAISHDAGQASLYSNRAACWAKKGEHEKALTDAEKCIALDPNFTKAYTRKGHALFYLKRFDEAEIAFSDGLKVDPTSEACQRGLEDIKEAREKEARRPRKRKPFEGVFLFMGEFAQRLKSGGGGYGWMHVGMFFLFVLLIIGVFFLWLQSRSTDSGIVVAVHMQRRFRNMDGLWLSYLEAGVSSNMKLLLLHRTSLSGEAELGAIASQILKSAPAGHLKVVIPDRPCHGYSLCPEGGETTEAFTWYGRLLAERPHVQQFAYLTSGRAAARHALEIVQRRRAVARILLFRPHMVVLDSKGAESPLVAAEFARWSLLGHEYPPTREERNPLSVSEMPKGCVVMLVYLRDDDQDQSLKLALEASGVSLQVEVVNSLNGLGAAASSMFGANPIHISPKLPAAGKASSSKSESDSSEFDLEPDAPDWSSWLSRENIVSSVTSWCESFVSRISLPFQSQTEEEW